ncbi:MAG: DUF1499 domain-containing protein [Gammaproteobacteria bacterium]
MKASIIVIILFIAVVVFLILGWYSARLAPKEITTATVFKCGTSPNCVSSEDNTLASQSIEALVLPGTQPVAEILTRAVSATGGTIVKSDAGVVVATYKSRIFGFVDDVVFKLDPSTARRVHVMSSSRVGYSDFGANRKRVEAIRRAVGAS